MKWWKVRGAPVVVEYIEYHGYAGYGPYNNGWYSYVVFPQD